MDDTEFHDFLSLLMCSDPWPEGVERDALQALADKEAMKRGYSDWIEAYHKHERPVERLHAFSGMF